MFTVVTQCQVWWFWNLSKWNTSCYKNRDYNSCLDCPCTILRNLWGCWWSHVIPWKGRRQIRNKLDCLCAARDVNPQDVYPRPVSWDPLQFSLKSRKIQNMDLYLSNHFLFFVFEPHLVLLRLFLDLHSGITSGGFRVTRNGAGDRTQINHMQGKRPTWSSSRNYLVDPGSILSTLSGNPSLIYHCNFYT